MGVPSPTFYLNTGHKFLVPAREHSCHQRRGVGTKGSVHTNLTKVLYSIRVPMFPSHLPTVFFPLGLLSSQFITLC